MQLTPPYTILYSCSFPTLALFHWSTGRLRNVTRVTQRWRRLIRIDLAPTYPFDLNGCIIRSLATRKLLGAPGLTTRNKKPLGAPGLTTRNKKLLEGATRGSWPYY